MKWKLKFKDILVIAGIISLIFVIFLVIELLLAKH